ncbi:BamA/TamA family outer membrane protein [Parasphingorhabdus sp.]|uniref:autotransporter assembly complex protein TamA n=1 Tax=Parasphingorhabdus sp. TaxID=2709688 RepID=UPI0032630687
MGQTAYRCRLFLLLAVAGFAAMPVVGSTASFAQTLDNSPDDSKTAIPAQLPDEQPLDPDQPLTDFPDFGVEWPDVDQIAEPEDVDPADDEGAVESEDSEGQAEGNSAIEGEPILVGDDLIPALSENFQPENVLADSSYTVVFAGLPPQLGNAFIDRFETVSALEQYRGQEANFAQIKRRAEADAETFGRLLRFEGYYDAVVVTRFAAVEATVDPNDVIITINTVPGPQYKFATIALPGLSAAHEGDSALLRDAFDIRAGDVINSDEMVAQRKELDIALEENGYPFAETGQPELVIDHAERDGDLVVNVSPGNRYKFGSVVMEDEKLFGPEHVQLIARFNEGELYRQSDLEDLRRALISTGLVSTISLEPVISQDPEKVDIAVGLTPAPLRTISGALGYGTGEGARAEVSWEHRNLFPPEGLMRLTGVLATQEQSGSMIFRRNNFRRRDNVLNGRVALSNIDRASFTARTFSIGASLERQSNLIYQKKWSWSTGIELIASQERDITGAIQTTSRDTFFIGSLPASVTYDASDNLLDPKSGFRIGARVAPEASLQSGSFFYVRSQIDGSAYFPASDKAVLAGRVRLGSIAGAGNNSIAPSRRLYSGGGGSVRGFGFQRIGPRDVNNDPVGGRSLVEFSLEARVRVGNFGIVPFVDAGNIYTESLPDFSGLRYGAGLGVRYYSDFGPIRVDVGTPINRQPGDSRIAVYVSLGQAF